MYITKDICLIYVYIKHNINYITYNNGLIYSINEDIMRYIPTSVMLCYIIYLTFIFYIIYTLD